MATFYADSLSPVANGDGLTLATAKRTISAAVALAGASVAHEIVVENGAGRIYRDETVTFAGKSGASEAAPLVVRPRDETRPVVLSGALASSGWTQCGSARSGLLGAGFASWYERTFTAATDPRFPFANPIAANLCEDGVQLNLACSRADTSDPYTATDPETWWTGAQVLPVGATPQVTAVTGFRHPTVLGQFTATQIAGSLVYYMVHDNRKAIQPVADVVLGTDGKPRDVMVNGTGLYENSALRDSFMLLNMPAAATGPGFWAWRVNANGSVTVFVRPRRVNSIIEQTLEYTVRAVGINYAGADFVEVRGFEVRQFSPAGTGDGVVCSVNSTRRGRGIVFRDSYIHDCMWASTGTARGMLYFAYTDDLTCYNVKLLRGQGLNGLFLQGTLRDYVHHIDAERCGASPLRPFGVRDSVIAFCRFSDCGVEAHSNAFAAYQGCHNLLIYGCKFGRTYKFGTWQASDSICVGMSDFTASRASAGGASALRSQQQTSAPTSPPGATHGYKGAHIWNNRTTPWGSGGDDRLLGKDNGFTISSDAWPNNKFRVHNNIYHGAGAEPWTNVVAWTHNITTIGAVPEATPGRTQASDNLAVPVLQAYVDPRNDVFVPPINGAIRTKHGRDMRDAITAGFGAGWPSLQARFPRFDGWDLDMNGQPIDWARAPVGPLVDPGGDHNAPSYVLPATWTGGTTTPPPPPPPPPTRPKVRAGLKVRLRVRPAA